MNNGKNHLMIDALSIVSTIAPDADMTKITHRLEEAFGNYEIERKTHVEIAQDLPEKVVMFISAKRLEGLSYNTLKDYELELRLFAAKCPLAVAQVSTAAIRSYLGGIDDVAASTIGKKLSVLKSFFAWLVGEEFILRDPTAKIKTPKTPKRLPKGLSAEHLEMVRESCVSSRERALLEIFYSTGCRLSEIANMNRSHLDTRAKSIRVIGKGDKERIVYLSFKALYHLERYLDERTDDCEALFVTDRRPHRRMRNSTIQQIVRRIASRADISTNLHPHRFRHTFATSLMDAGIDLVDLQHLLGHSSPATSLVYASVSEERKQRAHRKYHVQ
jgi:site-specific recombinase XerD